MLERIKGGAILFPLLFVLVVGGKLLYFTAFILSLLGLKEMYSVFRIKGFNPISIVAICSCTLALIHNIFTIPTYITVLSYFSLFVYTATLVICNIHNILDLGITILGALYIIIPFECIFKVYEINNQSFNLAWIIFFIAFSNDIFAYFIGKNFGKRKLIPNVSPNKTIEGSIGGVLGTAAVLSLLSIVVGFNMGIMIIVAILGSILAQIGDLFASSIKRYSGVKDFSNMIPGHGGIVDRFDSILFVAPLILILAYFICA